MPVLQERTGLAPLEWQALKVVARNADQFRDEVAVAKGQAVDMLVRIRGTIDVGEDGLSRRTTKPSVEDVLAFVLWALEVDLGQPLLAQQVLAAFRNSVESHGRLQEVEEGYHAQANMAIAAVSTVQESPRKGAVSGMFRVGQVELASLTKAVSGEVERFTRTILFEEDQDG